MSALRDFEAKIFNRINPAIKFSVTRYVLAVGVFVAIVVFGISSALGLGIDQLPTINIPVVIVSTFYPGATPSVIDQQITQVLENTVSTISGITDINSSSQTGSSIVSVMFDQSTDKNSDANQVASQVSAAIKQLPSGVNAPTVKTFDPNSAAVVQLGLTARGVGLDVVADYVTNDLLPNLERIGGVANITTDGAPTREFQVLLNPNKLRALQPDPAAGRLRDNELGHQYLDRDHQPSAQRAHLLYRRHPHGPGLHFEASRGLDARGQRGRRGEHPQYLLRRQLRAGQRNPHGPRRHPEDDGLEYRGGRPRRREGHGEDEASRRATPTSVSYDSTGPISASINNTYQRAPHHELVVALIVLLFLGKLNTALSVILAIPIALSASPILYKLCGFNFNLVSLLALVSAIGIVVDDSIVVSENVERYRAMGFTLKESVLKGASEVFSAVVAASLSLLSVLIPVSFIGGFVGPLHTAVLPGAGGGRRLLALRGPALPYRTLAYTPEAKVFDWEDFAQSFGMLRKSMTWGFTHWRKGFFIVLGLGVAAALAFTHHLLFLPAMILYPAALGIVYYLGRIFLTFFQALTMTLHNLTERLIDWVRDAYARALVGVVKRSVWILVSAAVFLVVTVVLVAPHIPFNFVPQADNGFMSINLSLPVGTPIDVTNEMTGRLEAYVKQQPEVNTVQTVVASTNFFTGSRFTYRSSMTLTLGSVRKRKNIFVLIPIYRQNLLNIIHSQFPSGRVFVSAGGGFGGSSSLQVNITSASFDLLRQRDASIIQAIQADRWVSDVSSSLSDTTLENDFYPSPTQLHGTGLTPASIGSALQIATSGIQASSVQVGGNSYPIEVMVDPVYLADGQSLLNLPIYSPVLQSNLQVGQVGSFSLTQAPTSMTRYNRIYYSQYTINMKPNAPPPLTVQDELGQELESKHVLTGDLHIIRTVRKGPRKAQGPDRRFLRLPPHWLNLSL